MELFEQAEPCTAGPYFEGLHQHFIRCPHYGSPLAECVAWATCDDCAGL